MSKTIKIGLESDFRDYYDHVFYNSLDLSLSGIFYRIANNPDFSLPKRRQFQYLESAGFRVLKHGLVKDVATENNKVVVYIDEYIHQGQGKDLLDGSFALSIHPEKYCSEYIGHSFGKSCRYLQIGDRSFVYWYQSSDDWKSNTGEVEISTPVEHDFWDDPHETALIGGEKRSRQRDIVFQHWAMFAIDLVPVSNTKLAAIDLNTAPGLKWTGMEDLMSPMDVYNAIKAFWGMNDE